MNDTRFSKYFIVREVQEAASIIKSLKKLRLPDEKIGVISRSSDFALADLPQVDLTEQSELPEALKRGALLGAGSGLLAGVIITVFPLAGFTLGGGALIGLTAGGGAIGAWSAAMIGVSESSPIIKQFDEELDRGRTLIIADMTDEQFVEISNQFDLLDSGALDERSTESISAES